MFIIKKLSERRSRWRSSSDQAEDGVANSEKTMTSAQTDKSTASGLYDVLEDEKANKAASTVIIAVHGLGGDWRETWESKNDKWNWIQSSIGPRLLEETGLAPRVLSFGYNSDIFWTQSVNDIQQVAEMLIERLYNKIQEMDNKSPRVVFIAHSLGGLVVKKAFNVAWVDNDRYGKLLSTFDGCIFMGVPHRGADLASWARPSVRSLQALSGGSLGNDKFVKGLGRNSNVWVDISRDFVHRAKRLKIKTFHETEKFMNQIIVDRDSAVMNLPNEVVQPLDGSNHQTICKFSRNEEQRYQPVWDALRELVVFKEANSLMDSKTLPSSQILGKFDDEAQKAQIAPVDPHYTQPPQGLSMNNEDKSFAALRTDKHHNTYDLKHSIQKRRRLNNEVHYKCLTCGTRMHHTEDCPWLGKDDLRCWECRQFGHYANKCCPQHPCTECGSKGHWKNKCRSPKGCFTCGQYDHWADVCPWQDIL